MATATLYPTAKAYVDQATPTTNHGNPANVFAGDANDEGSGLTRGWLRFDLSSITAGSTINSATLTTDIYAHSNDYSTAEFDIDRCTDNAWTQAGITWNNAPNGSMVGSPVILIADNGSGNIQGVAAKTTSITAMVAAALASGALNARIKEVTEGGSPGSYIKLYTSVVGGNPISLVVNYTAPSADTTKFFFG